MKGRRWLLSVGVCDYGDQVEFRNLHCAVNDACLVHHLLTQEYGFHGTLLAPTGDLDASLHEESADSRRGDGTRAEIIDQIDRIGRWMKPDDLFVFFFAGHGIARSPGYLLPFGAIQDRVSTYLMYRALYGELSALPCQNLFLLLNCCYSGRALRSSAIGAEVREGRASAIAACGPNSVAPDRVRGVAHGRYSPFCWALREALLEKTKPGEDLQLESIAAYLQTRVRDFVFGSVDPEPSPPTFTSNLREIRTGDLALTLDRPALRVEVPRLWQCTAGKLTAIPLKVEASEPRRQVSWNVEPLDRNLELLTSETRSVSPRETSWAVEFHYAGRFLFQAEARDAKSGQTISRTLEVEVLHPRRAPLGFCPACLPQCYYGSSYDHQLEIAGGHPPYRLFVETAPPAGLQVALQTSSSSARIFGQVGTPPKSGTEDCRDSRPAVFEVALQVEDARGRKASTKKRLPVFDPEDYCRIEAESFIVGYERTPERDEELRRMLMAAIEALQSEGRRVPRSLQKAVAQLANQTADQALALNPGSRVALPPFYIRRYPVTNLEWFAFLRATGAPHRPPSWDGPADNKQLPFAKELSALPVVEIPWDAIQAYLQWRGTRLPTSWEWELAARGTDGKLFPWGDRFSLDKCNTAESELNRLVPVHSYDSTYRSEFGTRDMVGNAAEWVDRRVFAPKHRLLAQPFRGGSFLDPCIQTLVFKDSNETGLLYGEGDEDRTTGQTAFRWVGFRDVVDLDLDPNQDQDLIFVPTSTVILRENGRETRRSVPGFHMSRYTVSNLEYFEFVQATGHPPPTDWTLRGDSPFPQNTRYYPVTRVSFRDALAFCLWKSRVLKKIIRLPTPDQWMAAVSGERNLPWPWGEEFNLQKCNSLKSGWGRRVEVHALSEGCSRHYIYNLVGNVCEWVAPRRVIWGSWQDDCEALQQSITATAQGPRNDIGFRYVALSVHQTRSGRDDNEV